MEGAGGGAGHGDGLIGMVIGELHTVSCEV